MSKFTKSRRNNGRVEVYNSTTNVWVPYNSLRLNEQHLCSHLANDSASSSSFSSSSSSSSSSFDSGSSSSSSFDSGSSSF